MASLWHMCCIVKCVLWCIKCSLCSSLTIQLLMAVWRIYLPHILSVTCLCTKLFFFIKYSCWCDIVLLVNRFASVKCKLVANKFYRAKLLLLQLIQDIGFVVNSHLLPLSQFNIGCDNVRCTDIIYRSHVAAFVLNIEHFIAQIEMRLATGWRLIGVFLNQFICVNVCAKVNRSFSFCRIENWNCRRHAVLSLHFRTNWSNNRHFFRHST